MTEGNNVESGRNSWEGGSQKPIEVDVRYRGNRLGSDIDSGSDLDFAMMFWIMLLYEKLDDEGFENPRERIEEAFRKGFDELGIEK